MSQNTPDPDHEDRRKAADVKFMSMAEFRRLSSFRGTRDQLIAELRRLGIPIISIDAYERGEQP